MSVTVKFEGQKEVQHVLHKLRAKTQDLTPLMKNIGAALVSSTQYRITDEKHAPDGSPWQPLSPRYAAWKAKKKPRIGLLEFGGDLVRSMTYNANADSVLVGSNKKYAARQHFGGKGIPARPYLGVSNEDATVIKDLIKQHYDANH